MSFSGDLYPTAGASVVMTTKGDMVDYNTARQRLAIGSANQILQVKSNLPSWETVDLADTVLTTAGDILYENATPELARLASGTQYNTLQMGASLPAWSASATSVLTTTGDILYASGANTLARLAGGTSGDVLTANGAGVAPSYQTAGGGATVEVVETVLGSTFTSSSTSFVDITGWSLTKPTISGGKTFTTASCGVVGYAGQQIAMLMNDSTGGDVNRMQNTQEDASDPYTLGAISSVGDADGATVQMKGKGAGGAWNIKYSNGNRPTVSCIGIG